MNRQSSAVLPEISGQTSAKPAATPTASGARHGHLKYMGWGSVALAV